MKPLPRGVSRAQEQSIKLKGYSVLRSDTTRIARRRFAISD